MSQFFVYALVIFECDVLECNIYILRHGQCLFAKSQTIVAACFSIGLTLRSFSALKGNGGCLCVIKCC